MAEKAIDDAAARSLFLRNEEAVSTATIQLFFRRGLISVVRDEVRASGSHYRYGGGK